MHSIDKTVTCAYVCVHVNDINLQTHANVCLQVFSKNAKLAYFGCHECISNKVCACKATSKAPLHLLLPLHTHTCMSKQAYVRI